MIDSYILGSCPACSSNYILMEHTRIRCKQKEEQSGSVVECLTRDKVVAGSSRTGGTALCPWASHFNLSLVLVQPRKTHPDMTEKLLTVYGLR